jgi:hypothetical protein
MEDTTTDLARESGAEGTINRASYMLRMAEAILNSAGYPSRFFPFFIRFFLMVLVSLQCIFAM